MAGTMAQRNERASGGTFTMVKAVSQKSEVRQELYGQKFKVIL